MDDDDTGNADLADMLAMDAPERSEKLAAHATVLQSQMEEIAEEVRELIAPQPPVALLGYLLGQTHIALMYEASDTEELPRLNSQTLQQHQLALEYARSEEHTSELQSLMRISYAVFCLKKKITEHRL